jgi:serine/threonine-protein kinase
LDLVFKVGNILKPVWEANYVHRDIKPQNIRIKTNGEPIVLDFGIARALDEKSITATGGQPLSWLFASPEQYEGNKALISYRTDFFCLGIIAYYLYTNELPYGKDRYEIQTAFQNANHKIVTNNEILNVFCKAVLRINPSERPRKIETFLKLLEL